MKNVLVSVLGSTPQILTETLWFLKVKKGIDIDEIYLITTSYGRKLIVEGDKNFGLPPLLGKDGIFQQFCCEFKTKPKFSEENIFVISDDFGSELDDIRNDKENEIAADFITRVIKSLTSDNNTILHCSVAGGRKTMSVYAALAITLTGRKNDHLYHVLVSPPEIEGNPEFFYKPSKPVKIKLRDGRKLSTDEIEITLAEIPFLRLGEKYKNIFSNEISYSELVYRLQSYELVEEPVIKGFSDEQVKIIGRNKKFKDALDLLDRYAKNLKINCVLLVGETGTGKELFAKHFVELSSVPRDKYTAVNCAGLSETLRESELFGHKRGAFTGAVMDKKGIFEEYNGGIVFLDEINKTEFGFQSTLLRFLDSGEIKKVGENITRKVNVRLLIGLNEEPQRWLESGRVFQDFYNRIVKHVVKIPPLRERKDDIPLLVKYFVKRYAREYNKNVKGVSKEVMRLFLEYDWRIGNVRELEGVISDMVARADEDEEILTHLPENFEVNLKANKENFQRKLIKIGGVNLTLIEFEKKYIEYKLRENNYNISQTAKALGIPRTTLQSKMKKLGIKLPK